MIKQSLFQVCNALFASSQSIANRTASQWLPPFACLGLTHAPASPLGLDRKEWLRRTVSWEGCYGVQRAVWRNGGCNSLENTIKQQVTWLVASVGSPPLRQAATTLCAICGQRSGTPKRTKYEKQNR